MRRRKPLELMTEIEAVELELTRLNAARALAPVEKRLEVLKVGGCTLLREPISPGSVYYNRIKGFGPADLPRLEELLAYYPEGAPSFDMTPDHMTGDVAQALSSKGYVPAEQLVFMAGVPSGEDKDDSKEPVIERVTERNAEEFIAWIAESNGGMALTEDMIGRAKGYFHRPDFMNYMIQIDGQPAAMGSLFLSGGAGYLANDYTFEAYRGRGLQSALVARRLRDAARMGAEAVYTDVEFGSVSHGNMEKAGFRIAFLNTFWMKG